MNYNFEQAMAEMVEAIGVSLEEQFLRKVQASTLMKQQIFQLLSSLGYVCIQHLGEGDETSVKYLKLMELSKGTADVITDAIVDT